MDAAMIARVMSVIPERTAWAHSGSAFVLQESHGAQVRYLAQFLNWLSPLSAITKDDQRALGLLATPARPAEEDPEIDGVPDVEDELEAEDIADFDPDATLPPFPPAREEEKLEVVAAAPE